MSKLIKNLLQEALQLHELLLEDKAVEQLVIFVDLLMQWNQVFNLTAIDQPREIVYLHLIDSLLVMPFLHGKNCLDVGSGGGFPGIPLAIALPHYQWTLLDKNSKKTRFLKQVVNQLELRNVHIVHENCQYFQSPIGFDRIFSRAFSEIQKMIEVTQHLLQKEGKWIAMKGKYPATELLNLPSSFRYDVAELNMIGMDVERHVISISRT